MSIWTRPLTSPQTDKKLRAAGSVVRRRILAFVCVGALAFWTYIVRGIHDYCYAMGAWSDGASKRGPDDWTPYVVLWFVPVLIAVIVGLMIHASMAKRAPNEEKA